MPEQRRVPGEARRRGGGVERRLAPDDEPLEQHAVHPDVERLRCAESADVVGVGALEAQPDRVLPVDREPVPDRDAAPRAEGQVLAQPLVLVLEQRDAVGLDARHGRRDADREPTDSPRRREIPLQQRWRDRQDRRHVVEAVHVGVVGRQQRRHVHLDLQQIAYGVPVLRPVEAMEGLGPAHHHVRGGGAIELGLQVADQRLDLGARGAEAARRGHRPHAQLLDDLLPEACALSDGGEIERVEREPGRAQPFVVTGDAVAVEQRPVRRGGYRGNDWLRTGLHRGAARSQVGRHDAEHRDADEKAE